jgi:hypothetical protein
MPAASDAGGEWMSVASDSVASDAGDEWMPVASGCRWRVDASGEWMSVASDVDGQRCR